MIIHPSERVGIFIDGAHLHAASRALGFDVDFKRLLDLFRTKARLVKAMYNIRLEDRADNPLKPLIDWLSYNGYSPMVLQAPDTGAGAAARGGDDAGLYVDLAVNVMEQAEALDHIVLFAGAGALRSLVAALQIRGKRISVVSTLATKPVMVADELRRQADQFVDLVDIESDIRRVERQVRRHERT